MTDIEILHAELLNNQTPLYCTRKELCDAVDRAVEALQEKAKREKGCEGCKYFREDRYEDICYLCSRNTEIIDMYRENHKKGGRRNEVF